MRSEFDFIQNIKKKYGLGLVGDDCAILPQNNTKDLLVTADLLVQDIDFRLDWTTPELLGSKALAVSLSDIAAMGGSPMWAILSIGIPEALWKSDFLDRFYEGWFALAKTYGVQLVGGDVSRTPDRIVVDSVVGGEVHEGNALRRCGARPGDSIFVTGQLGAAAGGLLLLRSGIRAVDADAVRKELIDRQLRPIPRVFEGIELSTHSLATAAIDLSDGLSSDLHHICEASGVGAMIFAETIPLHPGLSELELSDDSRLDMALNGGEDFELLFTSSESNVSISLPTPITRIGEITSMTGGIKLETKGIINDLPPRGFRHF